MYCTILQICSAPLSLQLHFCYLIHCWLLTCQTLVVVGWPSRRHDPVDVGLAEEGVLPLSVCGFFLLPSCQGSRTGCWCVLWLVIYSLHLLTFWHQDHQRQCIHRTLYLPPLLSSLSPTHLCLFAVFSVFPPPPLFDRLCCSFKVFPLTASHSHLSRLYVSHTHRHKHTHTSTLLLSLSDRLSRVVRSCAA